MFKKEHIIAEIIRTAKDNGGTPLGLMRFRAETGIKDSDWLGKYWARWGDALVEAGFEPNKLQAQRDDDELLENLASLAIELGHFPVATEMKMKARNEPGFPWHNTFARLGNKRELAIRLKEYCLENGMDEVAAYCDDVIKDTAREDSEEVIDDVGIVGEIGYVYLLKSGKYYKIGRTKDIGRRERELAIQLPEKAILAHFIKTDDPVGIEAYWHGRFKNRRKNGEWFELNNKDVTAFKRRKFM